MLHGAAKKKFIKKKKKKNRRKNTNLTPDNPESNRDITKYL